jgi:hypothetical protein
MSVDKYKRTIVKNLITIVKNTYIVLLKKIIRILVSNFILSLIY